MTLIKWQPNRRNRNWDNELAHWVNSFMDDGSYRKCWHPHVDLTESKDNYIIEMELPGVEKDNLSIELENDSLVVKGEKKNSKEQRKDDYYQSERRYGYFERQFELPGKINAEAIMANIENGVLTINVPKAEEAKLKKITIK